MNELDQDVERVNAIHAKLAGPQTVHVAVCDGESGLSVAVFNTREMAIEHIVEWVQIDFENHRCNSDQSEEEIVANLRSGNTACSVGEEYYSLHEELLR